MLGCGIGSTYAESQAVAPQGTSAVSLTSEEQAYRKAIANRAEKIVATLELADREQFTRVQQLVSDQHRGLRDIHDRRDQRLAGEIDAAERAKVVTVAESAVLEQHRRFVAMLAAEISAEDVDQIKEGMTYGVAGNTYQVYLELLPDLTADQRRTIKAHLLEAREYAMDGGSSKEKHAWFGKYKGRINNFLSAAGYDLKKAERDLAERRKIRQSAKSNNDPKR